MISLSDMFSFALPSISLPAIPLPANIQRRFLSFLLRRTIGHLVKPGQLDINQIEAQIGGGKVDIKDVELDPQVSVSRSATGSGYTDTTPSRGCAVLPPVMEFPP